MFPITNSPQLSRRALLAAGAAGVAAIGSPLLSGCSGPTDKGPEPTAAKMPAAPLDLAPEIADAPRFKEGYVGPRARQLKPFGDGRRTFRIVVPQDSGVVGDWSKNKNTAWFEQLTGVKVEFIPVLITDANGGSDLTKINAMLSGGQLPDAFMGIPFTDAQIALYGKQGVFKPLDDLISVYAPATRQAMKDYPDLRSLKVSNDGKLYTMLGVADCFHCRSSNGRAWISKTYLDKIGAVMPTTTDELRQVLLEFKNRNPSGKKGFVPLAAGVDNPLDNFFMQPFLYSPTGSQNGGWLRLNAGKVEFTPVLDGWREALRYLRRLGLDGLITEQTFSMTGTELQTVGNKAMIGFARAYWWGSFFNPVTLDKNAPWRDYVAVPPLAGPDGARTAQWDYYLLTTNGLQVTSACQDPATLVRWSDYQMDLQSVLHLDQGTQGENWFWGDPKATAIDGGPALWRNIQWPAPVGTSWGPYGTEYRSADYNNGHQVDPEAPTYEKSLYDVGKIYQPFAQPKEMQLPPVVIAEQQAAQAADTAATLQQTVKQGMSQFALGKKDINNDADWRAYTDALTGANLRSYLDIYQQAYDARPH